MNKSYYNILFPFRKRPREEENCDFMPLSKRINNLHINNRDLANVNSSERISSNQQNVIRLDNGIHNSSPDNSNDEHRPSYDPGLNSSQSNYYYNNKLLFELHLERIQRTGQQFPF